MGRYYSGDINGKFWFAVQPSDDAEQFGAVPQDSTIISYYADDVEDCESRLKELFTELRQDGRYEFEDDAAVDDYVASLIPADLEDVRLQPYASLSLGLKMYRVLKQQGWVEFEAEC